MRYAANPRPERTVKSAAASRAVMVAVLAVGACASPVQAPVRAVGQPPPPGDGQGGGPGPALGIYPPNATRVTAHVVRQTDRTLTIEIQNARQARPDVAMGPAVGTIDAVSRDPLDPSLTGRRIEAVISLVGDTQTSRWFISDIRTLPN